MSACNRARTAGLILVASLSVLSLGQSTKQRLQLSDRVGDLNRYRLSFDIRMRAEYSGEQQLEPGAQELLAALEPGMSMKTSVEYEHELIAVDPDGTRTFEVRWRDFGITGELGDQVIPQPPGHEQSMRELLSRPARIRTTPSGRTMDVTYGNPELAQFAEQFRQLNGSMPTYLPEEPVAVGDRWTSVVQFPVGVGAGGIDAMTLELEHRLSEVRQGPGGPIAVIHLSGSYSKLRPIEEVGAAITMHLQASLAGSTQFDIKRGRFIAGRYELDMFAVHAAPGIEIQLTGRADGRLELLNPE